MNTRPKIIIMPNNKELIKELQSINPDFKEIDDHSDHAADALRYFFMSGYQPNKKRPRFNWFYFWVLLGVILILLLLWLIYPLDTVGKIN